MTNSAFPRDRAEAQRSDSFRMQSEVALKKKKKKNIFNNTLSTAYSSESEKWLDKVIPFFLLSGGACVLKP